MSEDVRGGVDDNKAISATACPMSERLSPRFEPMLMCATIFRLWWVGVEIRVRVQLRFPRILR